MNKQESPKFQADDVGMEVKLENQSEMSTREKENKVG